MTGTFNTAPNQLDRDPVTVLYEPDEIILNVTANAPTFTSLGLTYNQQEVGGALDNLVGNGGDPALISELGTQANSSLPGIYDEISPANLTPVYRMSFALSGLEANLVSRRVSWLFGDSGFGSKTLSWNGEGPQFTGNLPASYEADMGQMAQPDRWGAFVEGLGDFGTVTGDGNGPGYQFSTGGVGAGLDYRLSKDSVVGLLLGYTQSGTSLSTGTVNLTGGLLGLYAGCKGGAFHLDALAEGGLNSYNTLRNALGGQASGNTQGRQFSGALGTGYDFTMGPIRIGPFATGQYTNVSLNGFSETGSMAPLSYESQSEGNLVSDLGVQASRPWDVGGGVKLSPSLRAAWEHVYQGNLDSLNASLNGSGFSVNGPVLGTEEAVLAAGLDALWPGNLDTYASYQGKVGMTNFTEQSVFVGMSLAWGGTSPKTPATVQPTPAHLEPVLPTVAPTPLPVTGVMFEHKKLDTPTPTYILAYFQFDLGQDTLRSDAFDALKQAVLTLQQKLPNEALAVVGHTDDTEFKEGSSQEGNQKLSLARAQAVIDLLAQNGVDPRRLIARGMGDTQPLVPNTSPENRAKNRRVELWSSADLNLSGAGGTSSAASDLVASGEKLAQEGRLKEAGDAYLQAIKSNPQDATAWYKLGNLYFQTHSKAYAVRCFEEVVKLKPENKSLADWLEKYKSQAPGSKP